MTLALRIAVADDEPVVRDYFCKILPSFGHEVVAVASNGGVRLTERDVTKMATFDEELRDYHPSTAQDVQANKRLERDALCGFISREGARWGIPTPVNDTLDRLLELRDVATTPGDHSHVVLDVG